MWKYLHIEQVKPQTEHGRAIQSRARAELCRRKGNAVDAIAGLVEAADLFRVGGHTESAGEAYIAAAETSDKLGLTDQAAKLYRKALDSFEAPATPAAIAAHRLGILRFDAGEYDEALKLHTLALQCLMEITPPSLSRIASSHHEIALTKLALDESADAQEHLAKCLSLSRELDDRAGEATPRGTLARSLMHQGLHREGFRQAKIAVRLSREVCDHLTEGIALSHMAAIALWRQHPAFAVQLAQRGIAAHERIGHRQGVATKLTIIAGAHAMRHRPTDALEAYRRAISIYEELHLPSELIVPYAAMGHILSQAGRVAEAIEFLEHSLDLALQFNPNLDHRNLPHSALARVPTLVSDLVRLTLRNAGTLFDVHRITEKARARHLCRLLGRTMPLRTLRIPHGLVTCERDLISKQQEIQRQIAKAANFDILRKLLAELDDVRQRCAEVSAELQTYDSSWANIRRGEPPSYDLMREELKVTSEDTLSPLCILEYFVLKDGILIWLFSQGHEPEFAEITVSGDHLEKLVLQYITLLHSPPAHRDSGLKKDLSVTESALSSTLLPDGIRSRIDPGAHICVIPHGILHHLPFCVLRKGTDSLVTDHTVSICDSVYAALHGSQKLESRCPPLSPRMAGVGVVSSGPVDELLRPIVVSGVRSATAIWGGAAFLGVEATPERLIELLRSTQIVHVMCHGYANESDNTKAGLWLSGERDPQVESVVSPVFPSSLRCVRGRDLVQEQLKSELVFLNACLTGLSEMHAGDEVVGLTRSLLWAGVRSVVGTLWEVHGEAAELLATEFYRMLRESHTSKAEALARAQRAVMRNVKFQDPYFWAPYYLVGNWR